MLPPEVQGHWYDNDKQGYDGIAAVHVGTEGADVFLDAGHAMLANLHSLVKNSHVFLQPTHTVHGSPLQLAA